MLYTKEDLDRMINNEKLSYTEIGKRINVSDTYVKILAKKLGVILPIRKQLPNGWTPPNKGIKKKKFCEICNKECNYLESKFCSVECMGLATKSKTRLRYDEAIKNDVNIAPHGSLKVFKKYILEEQDNKCAICSNPLEWNGLPLVLVLDHIDGKADNNKRNNLRCVCPNCDSQLPTFKSKNKNSDRKDRYLKNYKN